MPLWVEEKDGANLEKKDFVWTSFQDYRKVARIIQKIPEYPSLRVQMSTVYICFSLSCLSPSYKCNLQIYCLFTPNSCMCFPKSEEFSFKNTVPLLKSEINVAIMLSYNLQNLFIFLQLPNDNLYNKRKSQLMHCLSSCISLVSFNLEQCLSRSLHFMTLTIFKSTGQLFCKMPPPVGLMCDWIQWWISRGVSQKGGWVGGLSCFQRPHIRVQVGPLLVMLHMIIRLRAYLPSVSNKILKVIFYLL